MRCLLERFHDPILQVGKYHEKNLAVEKRRSNFLKAQVTDFMGLGDESRRITLQISFKRKDSRGGSEGAVGIVP